MSNINRGDASGYVWAFMSTACLGAIFIFSKYALQTMSRATFLPLWFFVATIATLVYLAFARQGGKVAASFSMWRQILFVGVLDATGMFAFFLEIDLIDPSLVAFFNNMATVYIVLFGLLLYKERLTRTELVGMALVLIGAGVITYQSGHFVLVAFLLAIFVSTLFRSLSYSLAKPIVAQIGPEVLLGYRNLILFVSSALYALVISPDSVDIPSFQPFIATISGSLLGPFLGVALLYRAVSVIDLAKVGIIRGIMPVFVLVAAFIAFRSIPSARQATGGIISMGGVLLIYGHGTLAIKD